VNDLIGTVRTMDSREIAKLLGARHADVFESISTQLPKVGYTAIPYTHTNDQNGQKYQYYQLPYRETMIIVSGYSVELRAKVIDRWMELERASAPAIPKTFSEALQLAADQAKEIEAQSAALALAAPKVEFFDAVADSRDTISIGELAKALAIPGLGQNNLFKLLRDKKILMQDNIPYQDYIDRGYFKIIEQSYPGSSGAVHINMKTVVFQKGVDYIRKLIQSK
jgi:anti-repressor protein